MLPPASSAAARLIRCTSREPRHGHVYGAKHSQSGQFRLQDGPCFPTTANCILMSSAQGLSPRSSTSAMSSSWLTLSVSSSTLGTPATIKHLFQDVSEARSLPLDLHHAVHLGDDQSHQLEPAASEVKAHSDLGRQRVQTATLHDECDERSDVRHHSGPLDLALHLVLGLAPQAVRVEGEEVGQLAVSVHKGLGEVGFHPLLSNNGGKTAFDFLQLVVGGAEPPLDGEHVLVGDLLCVAVVISGLPDPHRQWLTSGGQKDSSTSSGCVSFSSNCLQGRCGDRDAKKIT